MIPARVAASIAPATAALVPLPSSGSAGSAARSTSCVVAPRAASCARAYSTSVRVLEVLDGLPEIPTTARRLVESLTPARSYPPAGPPRLPAVPERPGARGGEPRPARGRPVFRLERVLDPAALLGRERDRRRVQRPAHARGAAADRSDVGGEAVHDPILHLPLRDVRHRARPVRADTVRGWVFGERIPDGG